MAMALVAGACSDGDSSDASAGTTSPGPSAEEVAALLGEREVTALDQPVWDGASATGGAVDLYETADAETPMFQLTNPTHESQLLSFLVVEEQDDRLRVLLPMRPNGSSAWIEADQVAVHPVEHRIVVDVTENLLSVYEGLKLVFREHVATGAASTPTPTGSFYVDFALFPAPFPEYENGMISLAAFSEVHQTFAGGIGQLAIHGWSDASVMGQNRSNGCVRVTPDMIERLKPFIEPGVPVDIVA